MSDQKTRVQRQRRIRQKEKARYGRRDYGKRRRHGRK